MLHSEADVAPATEFCLALIGEPMTRKSSLAIHFPAPAVLDADGNISRLRRHYPNIKFKWANPERDDNGTTLPVEARYNRCITLLNEMARDADVRTIIVDTAGRVGEYLVADILTRSGGRMAKRELGGTTIMNQEQWWPFRERMTQLITTIRGCGKSSVFIFHETTITNEQGAPIAIRPAIGSKLKDFIIRYFTDAWRCYTKQTMIDTVHPGGVAYMIRTEPLPLMQQLGKSGIFVDAKGAPLADIEWTWPAIQTAYPWLK